MIAFNINELGLIMKAAYYKALSRLSYLKTYEA